MDEHRNAPRHRVLKAGTIGFGGSAINCMVRNISDNLVDNTMNRRGQVLVKEARSTVADDDVAIGEWASPMIQLSSSNFTLAP
jgi:hypothetical protein